MPRLTDAGIRALPVPEHGQKIYSDELRGFAIRVSQGGSKTFILTVGSDRQRITIGRYPTISLADARLKAQRILRDRELGIEHRPSPTFQTVYDEYMGGREQKAAATRRADAHRLRPFLALSHRKIGEITADELEDVINSIDAPVTRIHAYCSIRGLFNYAVKKRHIDRNPALQLDTPSRVPARERVLTPAELRRAWTTAEAYGYPFGTICQLLILSGQRRNQIASLRVEWVDFGEKMISFPPEIMKSKQRHIIGLTPKMTEILKNITPIHGLYFSSGALTPFSSWSRYTGDFWKDAEIEGAVIHDFRRTWATLAAEELDVDERIIAAVLNHRRGTPVNRIYNRARHINRVREAMTAFEEWMIHLDSLTPSQSAL